MLSELGHGQSRTSLTRIASASGKLKKHVAAMTCHMQVGMCFFVQVYRHIVLAVCDASSGLYGAVGISRCRQLMDKPLKHPSLAALVGDYQQAYGCEFSGYVHTGPVETLTLKSFCSKWPYSAS